jgi:hypothetical protein
MTKEKTKKKDHRISFVHRPSSIGRQTWRPRRRTLSPTPRFYPALKKVKDVELVGIASSGGLHAAHSGKKFGFPLRLLRR